MRKRIGLIFILLLVALLAAALVACDPDPTNPLGPEDPSQSTYTVTFDLNGAAFEYEELLAPISGVKYGDTIPEPLDKDGKSIELQKEGYEFKGWTANNEDFLFGVTQIVSNTTIRAKFEAKKYYHIPDIYTTVTYEGGKYVLDPNGHAKKDDNGDPIPSGNVLTNSLGDKITGDDGKEISVPETDITLADNAIGPNTTIYSTYNATSPSRMAVPSKPAIEGEEQDNFCFWYYMTESEDKNGVKYQHPVQFSEWAKEGATDVELRKVTYTYDNPLTLYAMFESDLPFVTVEYYESEEEDAKLLSKVENKYRLGKNIPEAEKFMPLPSETVDHANGYDFNYWYFVYYTESEEEDADPVRNEQKFVFDSLDENGNSTNKDATSPMDAAHDENVPSAEQNFRPVTLKLYANWVKMFNIGSAAEYEALATEIKDCLDSVNAVPEGEDIPDDLQKQLDDYLTATIKFTANIDFTGKALSPLFDDATHPFAGLIDGGVYTAGDDGEQTLSGRNTLSNITVSGTSSASLFGYVDGTIKNLNVDAISVKATGDENANELYLGALASVSGGSFANCVISNVTFVLPSNAGLVYIGGLAGQFGGTANDETKGSITECSATFSLGGLTAKGFYIGGLVGDSGSSTTISKCTTSLTIVSVSATERQGAYSGLKIGGVAGSSVADLSACEATLTIQGDAISAKGTALIGGLLGQNAGSISRAHATLAATALRLGSDAPSQLLAVGGLIGLNEGDVINSYSDAGIALTVIANQKAQIGGLVGSNNSARADSQSDKEKGPGAINRCYSTGSVTVSADAAVTSAELYVGGMIGFSKHNKFANNFTLANVTVTYAKENLVHAGFLFGSLDKDATITSGYYANECKVTVNDKSKFGTNFVQSESKDESSDSTTSNDEATEEGGICSVGTPRPATDFADKDVVFGTNTDDVKDRLGWTGGNEDASKNIWELKKNASAPTLVDIGFPQESQEG